MAKQAKAYQVVRESTRCALCGEGELWTVIGPDNMAIGQSFNQKVDALEMALMLNDAFKLGKESK